jgi:hypothetical protein
MLQARRLRFDPYEVCTEYLDVHYLKELSFSSVNGFKHALTNTPLKKCITEYVVKCSNTV